MMCVWNHGKYSRTHTHNQISVRFPSNYCYYYGERNDKKKEKKYPAPYQNGKKAEQLGGRKIQAFRISCSHLAKTYIKTECHAYRDIVDSLSLSYYTHAHTFVCRIIFSLFCFPIFANKHIYYTWISFPRSTLDSVCGFFLWRVHGLCSTTLFLGGKVRFSMLYTYSVHTGVSIQHACIQIGYDWWYTKPYFFSVDI